MGACRRKDKAGKSQQDAEMDEFHWQRTLTTFLLQVTPWLLNKGSSPPSASTLAILSLSSVSNFYQIQDSGPKQLNKCFTLFTRT